MGISPNFRGETKKYVKLPARVCYWKKPAVHLFFYHWSGSDPNPEAFADPNLGTSAATEEVGFHSWKKFSWHFLGDGFLCAKKKIGHMFFVQFFVCSLRLNKNKWQFVFF